MSLPGRQLVPRRQVLPFRAPGHLRPRHPVRQHRLPPRPRPGSMIARPSKVVFYISLLARSGRHSAPKIAPFSICREKSVLSVSLKVILCCLGRTILRYFPHLVAHSAFCGDTRFFEGRDRFRTSLATPTIFLPIGQRNMKPVKASLHAPKVRFMLCGDAAKRFMARSAASFPRFRRLTSTAFFSRISRLRMLPERPEDCGLRLFHMRPFRKGRRARQSLPCSRA